LTAGGLMPLGGVLGRAAPIGNSPELQPTVDGRVL
jgi:hypothetical protein